MSSRNPVHQVSTDPSAPAMGVNETIAPSARRIFDHQRLWRLAADRFCAAADLLAAAEADQPPEVIVGIARGGLPLARALSERLAAPPVVEITARHNLSDEPYQVATGKVVVRPLASAAEVVPARGRLLVADDICGSGATLAAVCALLTERFKPVSLRSVVLCRNVGAAYHPDLWIWDTRDWVIFPWDAPVDHPTDPLPAPAGVLSQRGTS